MFAGSSYSAGRRKQAGQPAELSPSRATKITIRQLIPDCKLAPKVPMQHTSRLTYDIARLTVWLAVYLPASQSEVPEKGEPLFSEQLALAGG